jgi:hypothetical protein
MLRRHHLIVSALAVLTLPVFAAGCSDDEKATPQAVFDGRLANTGAPLDTAGGEKNCGEAGALFSIGEFGNPAFDPPIPTKPVKDGDSTQQGGAGVTCSVTPAGENEFNVSASLNLTGATGGSFTIRQAKVKAVEGAANGVSAVFSKRSGAGIVYQQNDGGCSIRFTTQYQGVAAGRIWGEITCPKVTNATAQVACEATAQFRFENCDQ